MQKKLYKKDQYIFREGGNPGEVYLILEGEVNIIKQSDGKNVHLAKLTKNAIFGEMALIDNQPRSASAIAASEEVKCMALGVIEFNEKLESMDPFLRGVFRVLVSTVRDLTAKNISGQHEKDKAVKAQKVAAAEAEEAKKEAG